jgi:methyl coenzyme M reductase subunit C-like uncharacterized protein (methanogenesis marker protein 7)
MKQTSDGNIYKIIKMKLSPFKEIIRFDQLEICIYVEKSMKIRKIQTTNVFIGPISEIDRTEMAPLLLKISNDFGSIQDF